MSQLITRSGTPIRILMVEDNEGDVLLTREALREAGIDNEMFCIRNGEAAIQFLREGAEANPADLPGLILMDINMPKLSGHEVMADMRQDSRLSDIPVFLFTSSEAPADIQQSKTNAANGYLVKPLDIDLFRRLVSATPGLAFAGE
jgi:chemotaxis family two-component system response regulator Rcp1